MGIVYWNVAPMTMPCVFHDLVGTLPRLGSLSREEIEHTIGGESPMRKRATITALTLMVVALAIVAQGCAKAPEPVAITPEPSIESSLDPVHPDEPVASTFNERFSLENALSRIEQLKEVAPQGGEEGMAFRNWVGAIEGTLRKQDYMQKKAEFDFAKAQFRDKAITQEEYDQAEAAFRKAEADFVAFWEQFGIGD